MGTIGSKMGRKFEQKRKAKWVNKKQFWSRPTYNHFKSCCYRDGSEPDDQDFVFEEFVRLRVAGTEEGNNETEA